MSENKSRLSDPRRLRALRARACLKRATQDYFAGAGYLEVDTPLLVPCPGMEPHIRPMAVTTLSGDRIGFLPTSPEFAMKRLLVGGLPKIFQISKAFRHEPVSPHHSPEFTMLEFYRIDEPGESVADLRVRRDVEAWTRAGAKALAREGLLAPGVVVPEGDWPEFRIPELFRDHADLDLLYASTVERMARACVEHGLRPDPTDTWDDLYFRIWLNVIEPRLPRLPFFWVHDYPPSQAALAVVREGPEPGSRWARRFELYAHGSELLELGNGFYELTDPIEQRKRFEADMELRARQYGGQFPKTPLDEGFLNALEEGLPPSSGIALGFDRWMMTLIGESDLDRTLSLRSIYSE